MNRKVACPSCGRSDGLSVQATGWFRLNVYHQGCGETLTHEAGEAIEREAADAAACDTCGWAGCVDDFTVNQGEICADCRGTGEIVVEVRGQSPECPDCEGTGRLE